jgi:uncharacterized protein (TIGR01370 family)
LGTAGILLNKAVQAENWLAQSEFRWAMYYGEELDSASLRGFNLVVLDPGFKGSVPAVAPAGAEMLGYLSLGEIKRTSTLFSRLTDPDVLLAENPHWPDTFLCDVRRPGWQKFILDIAIPDLLQRGFTGVFFDTLDTPPYLEVLDPQKYRGMRSSAIEIVKYIRKRFPKCKLVMNRGYALLPELKEFIDAVVAESLLTSFDFKAKNFKWVDAVELGYHLTALQSLKTGPRSVPILSLDYWDVADVSTISDIYTRERRLGHHPYVAPILLDSIVREPGVND